MPIHCVYMRERSSILIVCVREREGSIRNTTTISLDSSVRRTVTCINAHILTPSPGPCPPQGPHNLFVKTLFSMYLSVTYTHISLHWFDFSQYLTHTHHIDTPPPPSTQFIPIQGYTATTLACASLHPNMHNTSIFKEGIEKI